MPTHPTTRFLVVLLGGSGVLHFLRPAPFIAIVPRRLPAPEALVLVSGAAEMICSVLLAGSRTRRVGAPAAAALLVAVFPANVSMALRSVGKPGWYRTMAWLRLPLQIPLVHWALRAAQPPIDATNVAGSSPADFRGPSRSR